MSLKHSENNSEENWMKPRKRDRIPISQIKTEHQKAIQQLLDYYEGKIQPEDIESDEDLKDW
jgi:hypothetical protein